MRRREHDVVVLNIAPTLAALAAVEALRSANRSELIVVCGIPEDESHAMVWYAVRPHGCIGVSGAMCDVAAAVRVASRGRRTRILLWKVDCWVLEVANRLPASSMA